MLALQNNNIFIRNLSRSPYIKNRHTGVISLVVFNKVIHKPFRIKSSENCAQGYDDHAASKLSVRTMYIP